MRRHIPLEGALALLLLLSLASSSARAQGGNVWASGYRVDGARFSVFVDSLLPTARVTLSVERPNGTRVCRSEFASPYGGRFVTDTTTFALIGTPGSTSCGPASIRLVMRRYPSIPSYGTEYYPIGGDGQLCVPRSGQYVVRVEWYRYTSADVIGTIKGVAIATDRSHGQIGNTKVLSYERRQDLGKCFGR